MFFSPRGVLTVNIEIRFDFNPKINFLNGFPFEKVSFDDEFYRKRLIYSTDFSSFYWLLCHNSYRLKLESKDVAIGFCSHRLVGSSLEDKIKNKTLSYLDLPGQSNYFTPNINQTYQCHFICYEFYGSEQREMEDSLKSIFKKICVENKNEFKFYFG